MKQSPHVSALLSLNLRKWVITLIGFTLVVGLVLPYTIEAKSPAGNLHRSGVRRVSPDAGEKAKAVVEMFVAGNFEGIRSEFDDNMRANLTAEKMREVWNAAIAYHGPFRSQGAAQVRNQQGWEVAVIRCEMAKSPMEVEVDYNSEGKIGGLWIRPAAA